MIGVSLYSNIRDIKKTFLIKESWHKNVDLSICEKGRGISIFATTYDGYPLQVVDNDYFLIIVEGCIYNLDDNSVNASLGQLVSSKDIREAISDFVQRTDGDYIIYIKEKSTGKVIIFNDELGALPFHYYVNSNDLIASRSLSFVAVNAPKLSVSKENFAEKLTMNYNMFDRTIFNEIYHILPSECLCFEMMDDKIVLTKFRTTSINYQTDIKFKTKDQALDTLVDLFLEGCKNRCDYSIKHGYSIVNTMSGGFDSRTVLAGIEKFVKNYINITYEYKQDESFVAKKCLKAIDSRSQFVKQSFDNKPDYSSPSLALKTDGKVTMYITSICYNDLMYSIQNILKDKKVMYFGGFGGEFIRHPLFNNVWNAGNIGSSFTPDIKEVSNLCNVDVSNVRQIIYNSFKDSHKKGDSFCKEFYEEYYRRYVRNAGEDRDRMFFFTAQPLMSKDFVKTIWSSVPLSWVGFRFHINFIKKISPALAKVELFGNVDINSNKSIFWADYKHKGYVINQLKRLYRRFIKTHDDVLPIDDLLEYTKNIPNDIINTEVLRNNYHNYSWDFKTKLLSLFQFLSQIYLLRESSN